MKRLGSSGPPANRLTLYDNHRIVTGGVVDEGFDIGVVMVCVAMFTVADARHRDYFVKSDAHKQPVTFT